MEGETKEDTGDFPHVTATMLDLYLRVITEDLRLGAKTGKETDLTACLKAVYETLGKVAGYNHELLPQWKMALVMQNRTVALTSAFITGLAVGMFMAKPELLPPDTEVDLLSSFTNLKDVN